MKTKGFFCDPSLTNSTCPVIQKMALEFITKHKTNSPKTIEELRLYATNQPKRDFYMVAKKHNPVSGKYEYETFVYPAKGFPAENFTIINKNGTVSRVGAAQGVSCDVDVPLDIDRYIRDAMALVGQFSDNRATLPKLFELFGTKDFVNKDAGKKSLKGFRKTDQSTWICTPYSHSYAVIPNERNRLLIIDVDYPEKFKNTELQQHLTNTLTVHRSDMGKVLERTCKFKLVYKIPNDYDTAKIRSFNSVEHGFEVIWNRDATIYGMHSEMSFYQCEGTTIEDVSSDILKSLEKYTATVSKMQKVEVPDDLREQLEHYGFEIVGERDGGAIVNTDIIYDRDGSNIDAYVRCLDPLKISVFQTRFYDEVKKWFRLRIKEVDSKSYANEE